MRRTFFVTLLMVAIHLTDEGPMEQRVASSVNVTVEVGSPALLECLIKGPQTVHWTKEVDSIFEPVHNVSGGRVSLLGTNLKIHETELGDGAKYMCKAGNHMKTIVLTVTRIYKPCRDQHYYHNNSGCLECPGPCKACTSDTNCTECKRNYYGLICQFECPLACDGECQKEYGYCTFGCRDGKFMEPFNNTCSDCPNNCALCNSSTECVECHPGYHGKSCEYQSGDTSTSNILPIILIPILVVVVVVVVVFVALYLRAKCTRRTSTSGNIELSNMESGQPEVSGISKGETTFKGEEEAFSGLDEDDLGFRLREDYVPNFDGAQSSEIGETQPIYAEEDQPALGI